MEIDINGFTLLAFGCGVLVGVLAVFCFTAPPSSMEVVAGDTKSDNSIRKTAIDEIAEEIGKLMPGWSRYDRLQYAVEIERSTSGIYNARKRIEVYLELCHFMLQAELPVRLALMERIQAEKANKAQADGLSERVRQLAIENKV